MNLKELKKIIAEEYRYWIAEQPDNGDEMGDMPGMSDNGDGMDLPQIDMDPDMDIDPNGPGDEDAEATLKDIFDMLKTFFEGDDAPTPPKPKAPADDKKDDDKKDDKKETNEAKRVKMKRALKILENKGLLGKRKIKSKRPNINQKSPLVERFKKLANIIK